MPRVPYKTLTIKPIDGLLDTRATPDEVPVGGFRWLESVEVSVKGKLCRMSGYRRLLDTEFTNNADLHDQLLSIAERTIRQPILFLYEHVMPSAASKFFAATANALYALNNSTGNWKVIGQFTPAESASCADVMWSAAGFGDVVVFSNGVDAPVYHVVDQPANDDGQSVQPIADLVLLKITRVRFVKQWAGLTFYCGVVEDAASFTYRVAWSDYENPLSVKPKASASVAGYKDLDFGEILLNAAELSNSLLFYTNRSIWVGEISGDAGVAFSKRYAGSRPGDRCLVYPRTLISVGAEHYYMGDDSIYVFSLYVIRPERVDWIYRACGVIYEDIDPTHCLRPCGGHQVEKKQVWFSWPRVGESCNSRSLVLNLEFPFAAVVPQGFSAFGNLAFTRQTSVRQFLLERCICDAAGLQSAGLGFEHEGGFCGTEEVDNSGCVDSPPTSFYSNDHTVSLDGLLVEDLDFGGGTTPDADSLCAQLAGLRLSDLCQNETAGLSCQEPDRFVLASTEDFTLKEANAEIFYRERCLTFTGCGSYEARGYRSPMRSGPIDLGLPDQNKILTKFSVEALPAEQTKPSLLTLKIGSAVQAHDPNKVTADGRCVILYQELAPIQLKCLGTRTGAEYRKANVRPDIDYAWGPHLEGRFLYFELDVTNPRSDPVDAGGAVCISRFTMRVNPRPMGRL